NEESTLGRLDRMLNIIGVGSGESAEVRAAMNALQRVGAISRESRLAWQGSVPVLITPSASGVPHIQDARSILDIASNPTQLQQLVASRATMVAPEAVVPATPTTRGEAPERLDRFNDLSRMFGPRKAVTMLAEQVLESGDAQAMEMLRESVVGEVTRLRPGQVAPMSVQAEAGARPSATIAERVDPILRLVGMGQTEELRLPVGYGSTAETIRLAVTP